MTHKELSSIADAEPDLVNEINEILANNNTEIHVVLEEESHEIDETLAESNNEIHEILVECYNEINEIEAENDESDKIDEILE